jgi:hypothetical protein
MIDYLIVFSFLFFLFLLLKNLGKGFPIFELAIVLYLLQYCVTALLVYRQDLSDIYIMRVRDYQYLPFTLGACLAFASGLYLFKPKINLQDIEINPELASRLGRYLLAIGIFFRIAMPFMPESLGSVLNFFAILSSSGVYALVFSDKKIDKILVLIFSVQIGVSAILGGLLIGFIVYAIFLYLFLNIKYNISNTYKLLAIGIGVVFLGIYQTIKHEYREKVWGEEVSLQQKVSILQDLISLDAFEDIFNSKVSNNASYKKTVIRLNQGYQTSMAMNHVPRITPFQEGKALLTDILSSFLPRALVPDKRIVNDREYFYKYTGYRLDSTTSMSIGVIGDFYINFGFFWSIPFMFLFGVLMSKLLSWLYRNFIFSNPINLIWLPYIFSYFIRPGNEFYFVLNHIIKSLFVFFIIRKFVYAYINNQIVSKSSKLEI